MRTLGRLGRTRGRRRRSKRLGVWTGLLLACVFCAQAGLVAHRIDHEGTPQKTACMLCVAAGHLSSAPATELRHEPPALSDETVCRAPAAFIPCDLALPYESRAPPSHA